MAGLMRISELAQAADVSKRTVDFYTNLGLIQPAERTSGGFRLYDPSMVEIIGTVRRLEASGMGLDAIAKQLSSTSAADLAEIINRLGNDIEALRTLAETTGSSAQLMATTLMVRAHHLVVMATELLTAMSEV